MVVKEFCLLPMHLFFIKVVELPLQPSPVNRIFLHVIVSAPFVIDNKCDEDQETLDN